MKRIMRTLGITIISVLLLYVGVLVPVAAQEEVSVSINAPDRVMPDSDFTATVDIAEVVDLNAAQYDISFDPSILRLDDITAGQIDSTEIPVQFNEVSPGTYRVIQSMGLEMVSGSGYLSVLHFHALLAREGDINLFNGLLSGMGGEIQATWIGDSVAVNTKPIPPEEVIDATPPRVVSISPMAGATGVLVTTPVKATFSEAMDSSTITADSFSLRSDTTVRGRVSYDISTNAATFIPDASLEYSTTYTITLSSTIADTAGSPLSETSWNFTTAQAPAEVSGNTPEKPAIEDRSPAGEATSAPAPSPAPTARPVNWPVLWGVTAGVVVVGLLILLLARPRSY